MASIDEVNTVIVRLPVCVRVYIYIYIYMNFSEPFVSSLTAENVFTCMIGVQILNGTSVWYSPNVPPIIKIQN